jgi:hypothetical protein
MKSFIKIVALLIIVPFFVNAQNFTDALRYSSYNIQGTARAGAMGNAFGSLGGDYTSVSINPAGIGLYRGGELVLTPAFGQTKVETDYLGTTMTDSKYDFSFNNISYVANLKTNNPAATGLVNVNVGIGYNRLWDFNSVANVMGHNVESSFLDNLIENANGEDPSQGWSEFYEELAYYDEESQTGADLIYYEDEFWRSDIQRTPTAENIENYEHSQSKSISREGSLNEYSFAVGLNFNHKFYAGVSVGVVDVYFEESSTFTEWDAQNNIPQFNEMQFDRYLRTTGTGYNGKIGIIYKPVNQVRLGASLHTPTFYDLQETFDTYMYSNNTFEDLGVVEDEASSPINDYDYDLETPLRATFSGAFVVAKKGLLSVDYELVNYGSSSLRRGGDGYQFMDENSEISEIFKTVGNLRIGGELLATDNLSLRAGYSYYPFPYKQDAFGVSQPNADANLNIYTAGLGYNLGGFFIDIAYNYSVQKTYNLLYEAPVTDYYPAPEMASFNAVKNKVFFTFGFKF